VNIDGFIGYLEEQERAENTIDLYVRGVKQFFEIYPEVSQETVLKYKKQLMEKNKPKTVNARLSGILSYCNYVGADVKVKGLKVPKALSVENVISTEELNKLTKALLEAGNVRGYWIVMFLVKTGARVSEFTRFTKTGLMRGYEEMFTKGKVRRIYYPASLVKDSQKYFETVDGEILFPSVHLPKYRGKPLISRGVAQMLKTMARKYGIRREVMYPHGFRHYFAKQFLKNGGELTLLSDLLGHEDLATTAIYTRKSTAEITDELSRLVR